VKKILLVSSAVKQSTYGGGQIYIQNLAEGLRKSGCDVIIAYPFHHEENYNSLNGGDVFFKSSSSEKELKSLLVSVKPTIVHANGYKAVFSKACKQLGIPLVITAHHGGIVCPAGTLLNYKEKICHIKANSADCLPCVLKNIRGGLFFWPLLAIIPLKLRIYIGRLIDRLPFIFYLTPVLQSSWSVLKKVEEWKITQQNASLIVAPSDAIAESMKINGADPQKIRIITHGIPVNLAAEGAIRDKNQPVSFFYSGRINYVKGLHVMLKAFLSLKSGSELHIIGDAGNKTEERYKMNLQKQYKKNKNIFWHGKKLQTELYKMIINYDILIHPAIYLEVFGLNISEALSLGKPVISTRCGGPEMQITDGVNGWLAEPNSVESLLDKMKVALEDFRKMNVASIKVKTIETHVHELTEVYEEACNRR
jgi:glycosyltransferase involved in cell wall biosynthesis